MSSLDLVVYSSSSTTSGEVYYYDALQGVFGVTELLTGGIGFPISFMAAGGSYIGTQQSFLGARQSAAGKYVIIKNTSASPYSLCISTSQNQYNIIGPISIIRADGRMQDTFVSLETVKANRFPSILLQ